MKKIITIVYILGILLLTSCGKAKGVVETETVTEKESLSTSVVVNGVEVRLDMTEEELIEALADESLIGEDVGATGPMKKNSTTSRRFTNDKNDNLSLGQKAYVKYFFESDGKRGYRIRFVGLTFYGEEYDVELIEKALREEYGNNCKEFYLEFYFNDPVLTYQWDMEDGVSILWMPLEKDGDRASRVYMVYTEDMEEPEESTDETIVREFIWNFTLSPHAHISMGYGRT